MWYTEVMILENQVKNKY